MLASTKRAVSCGAALPQSLWKDVPAEGAAEDEDEEDADFTVDLDRMLADADAAAAETQARAAQRDASRFSTCSVMMDTILQRPRCSSMFLALWSWGGSHCAEVEIGILASSHSACPARLQAEALPAVIETP